jgi:hypothetical protein
VYGADPGLRADLEAHQTGYVLAVADSHQVVTAAGPSSGLTVSLTRDSHACRADLQALTDQALTGESTGAHALTGVK